LNVLWVAYATHSTLKPLVAWHGHGMLCVNRPLNWPVIKRDFYNHNYYYCIIILLLWYCFVTSCALRCLPLMPVLRWI
jgi:hypothetical protein